MPCLQGLSFKINSFKDTLLPQLKLPFGLQTFSGGFEYDSESLSKIIAQQIRKMKQLKYLCWEGPPIILEEPTNIPLSVEELILRIWLNDSHQNQVNYMKGRENLKILKLRIMNYDDRKRCRMLTFHQNLLNLEELNLKLGYMKLDLTNFYHLLNPETIKILKIEGFIESPSGCSESELAQFLHGLCKFPKMLIFEFVQIKKELS